MGAFVPRAVGLALVVTSLILGCGPSRPAESPTSTHEEACEFNVACMVACDKADQDPEYRAECDRLIGDSVDSYVTRTVAGESPGNEELAQEGPGAKRAPSPLSPAAIFRRARSAVVVIRTPDGLGSGFVVHASGVVVTNLHVVAGQTEIKVLLANGKEAPAVGIEALDDQRDLVALRIKRRAPSLALAESDRVAPGQPVVAIGSPLGLEATISEGIVSGLRAFEDGTRVVQVTAPISPGSSGGPILNVYGEVIAVATFKILGGENLGFGMPVRYVHELLARPRRMKLAEFAEATADARHQQEDEAE